MSVFRPLLLFLLAAVLLGSLGGCAPFYVGVSSAITPAPGEENMKKVCGKSRLQSSFGDLTISPNRFSMEHYTDDQGNAQKRPSLNVTLKLDDFSRPYQHVQTHVGQEIAYGKYRLKVIEINRVDLYNTEICFLADVGEEPGVEWPATIRGGDEVVYVIPSDVQLIYPDNNLLIGAGHFSVWDYEEQGKTILRETCVLWLATRDDSLPRQHVRVYTGSEVEYGKYRIKALFVPRYDQQPEITPTAQIAIDIVENPY